MSRLGLSSRFIRLMHTSGRQVPHPGQGGAPQVGTTSPSAHSHLPASTLPPGEVDPIVNEAISHLPLDPSASSASSSISNTYPAGPGAPTKFTPKGRAIPVRPARSISVNLPSGYPEPSSYPVTQEYVDSLQAIEGEIKPHPLWQFFHVPEKAMQAPSKGDGPLKGGMGSLDVQGEGVGESQLNSGRSWSAAELRQMSFTDLHTLWFVLLKERNVLATQREERRRLSVHAREGGELQTKRAFRCRKSMARIKYVLNERRLALIAASAPFSASTTPTPLGAVATGHVPFSATGAVDPALGLQAVRGEAALPAWVYENMQEEALTLTPEEEGMIEEGEEGAAEAEAAEQREEAEETKPVVEDNTVAKQEVESRDEGWGGGEEAREFVRDVQVKDGHVQKK